MSQHDYEAGVVDGKALCAAGPWIAVSERLPPENKNVLATTGKGVYLVILGAQFSAWGYQVLTHWATLNQPPDGK